jgi:hypothetical protein
VPPFRADAVALIRSDLYAGGAVHTTVASLPFASPS